MIATKDIVENKVVDIFKALSHRRQTGILQLTAEFWTSNNNEEQCSCLVKVVEGMFVEVMPREVNVLEALCERLEKALLIENGQYSSQEFLHNFSTNFASRDLSALFQELVLKKLVSEFEFARAFRAIQVDALIKSLSSKKIELEFTPKVVRSEPRWCVSLSPAQIVLDVFEYLDDRLKFESIFGNISDSHVVVERKPNMDVSLNSLESTMYYLLEEALAPEQIFERLLYGKHEIMQALLSLFERDAIFLRSKSENETELSESLSGKSHLVSNKNDLSCDLLWTGNLEPKVVSQNFIETEQAEINNFLEDNLTEKIPDVAVGSLDNNRQSTRDYLLYQNYMLLDPKRIQLIVLVTILFFLFMSALILPGKLESFFFEMSKFSFFARERVL